MAECTSGELLQGLVARERDDCALLACASVMKTLFMPLVVSTACALCLYHDAKLCLRQICNGGTGKRHVQWL